MQGLRFERRLWLCDPEVATVNSSWELTVGSSWKEKPTATNAVTVGFPSKVGQSVRRSDVIGRRRFTATFPARRGSVQHRA